jgi:hypothetical protein
MTLVRHDDYGKQFIIKKELTKEEIEWVNKIHGVTETKVIGNKFFVYYNLDEKEASKLFIKICVKLPTKLNPRIL